jgi:hypothetical protein
MNRPSLPVAGRLHSTRAANIAKLPVLLCKT